MKKITFSSQQIIILLIAFLVGVGITSYIKSDREKIEPAEDAMTEEVSETPDEEGKAVEEMEEETGEKISTTPTPIAKPATGTVSGKCSTSLSGYKDLKLNAIVLNWSACNSDNFQFYKLVKSSKNSNPTYPADPVAFSSSNKNVTNFVDKTVAARTTYYYRACAVQRLNQADCSQVVSVSF